MCSYQSFFLSHLTHFSFIVTFPWIYNSPTLKSTHLFAASVITSTISFHFILLLSPVSFFIFSFHFTLVGTFLYSFFSVTKHFPFDHSLLFTVLQLFLSTCNHNFLGLLLQQLIHTFASHPPYHLVLFVLSYHKPILLVPFPTHPNEPWRYLFQHASQSCSHTANHSLHTNPVTPKSPHTLFLAFQLPAFAFQAPPIKSPLLLHIPIWFSMSLWHDPLVGGWIGDSNWRSEGGWYPGWQEERVQLCCCWLAEGGDDPRSRG